MYSNRFQEDFFAHCLLTLYSLGSFFFFSLMSSFSNVLQLLMSLYIVEECPQFIYSSCLLFFSPCFCIILRHRCPANSLSRLSISHCTTKASPLIQNTFFPWQRPPVFTLIKAQKICKTMKRKEKIKSTWVGRRVAVRVRPLMYVKTDMCAQILSVRIVSVRFACACVCTLAKP